MAVLFANEVFKLRTVRTWWVALLAAEAVVLLGAAGRLFDAGTAATATVARGAVAHVGLVSLFLLVLGITAVAGEYRNRTIVDTYLTTPQRARVVWAKLTVYTAVGLLFGVACAATVLAETALWLAAKGLSLDLADAALWRTLGGGIVWDGLFCAIGVGVGALVRNLPGAIAGALAWLALVEGVLAELVGSVSRWLPANLGTRLGDLPQTTTGSLPQWLAGLALAGYTVAIAIAALATSVRRDVL